MGEALNEKSAVEALKALRQQAEPTEDQAIEPVEGEPEPQETEVSEEISEEIEGTEQPEPVEGADTGAETYDLGAEELADLIGIKHDQLSVDDEGKISFKAKVGDEYSDVSLESLINAYQGNANLTNRSKALAEKEREQQSLISKLDQQSTEFAQKAAAILDSMKAKFVQPYSKEELKALREEDPAEYAARVQEINEREKEFQSLANEALRHAQSPQQSITQETQKQYVKYLEGERQKVREAVPNWEKVEPEVANYASDTGWSEQEIGMLADSRIQVLMYKAMMFDKGKEGVKKKLSKPLPRITKPGKMPSKGEISLENEQKLRTKLKDSGKMEDAVALLRNRRK